ncbi:hypothetical protein C8F04DRAFT_1276234 [Mycena alexandri]|uniref:BTB domain-containing protein n=1 Tax=Mycena alexandri TaxID=1745969 RepID=A0AAD6S0Y5_9AGAR|nr:hypothetical protein C8F04DRAFT_978287 [Mycena alexandri]KAJ7019419.1 hypothetical protein C8F04DRAFT_1276234 [Mycena alexandri]
MPPRFIIQDQGTIRETRDDSPQRPRKRQRTDSGIDTGGYSDNCLASSGPVEDDPEFYRPEAAADCVVRVGNIRFKIQRSFLYDASPVLQDILDRHQAATRGADAPLVLIADADEFRALSWALYASPRERAAQPREHEDLDRLLLIAGITRQYRCASLEAWSMAAIIRTVTADSAFIASCSSALFRRIMDCAIRTHSDALLEATISQWAVRIMRGDAPCVPAILAADAHELSHFRGIAYYAHIQVMTAQQTALTERGATQFQTDPKLSNAQVMRLLSGHWSLVSLWERLRRAPPKFSCAQHCAGRCVLAMEERWRVAAASSKINALSSASVLALLAAMRDLLVVDQELTQIPAQCKLAALEAVKSTAKLVEDGLADHFFGWL